MKFLLIATGLFLLGLAAFAGETKTYYSKPTFDKNVNLNVIYKVTLSEANPGWTAKIDRIPYPVDSGVADVVFSGSVIFKSNVSDNGYSNFSNDIYGKGRLWLTIREKDEMGSFTFSGDESIRATFENPLSFSSDFCDLYVKSI